MLYVNLYRGVACTDGLLNRVRFGDLQSALGFFRHRVVGKVGHLIRSCSISYVDDHVRGLAFAWYVHGANLNYAAHCANLLSLAQSLGFDLVWFALIMLLSLEISFTTPPFGLLLFVMKGCTPWHHDARDLYFCVPVYRLFSNVSCAFDCFS